MARIYIASVTNHELTYSTLIILTEPQEIDGEIRDLPLGEATVDFSHDLPMDEIKKRIIKAAEAIFKAHQNAQDKASDLRDVPWPDIPSGPPD